MSTPKVSPRLPPDEPGSPAPKVSVVLSNLNGERYLCEALESVEAQNFRDFEAVLVDDGSTDGSVAILEAFAQRDPQRRRVLVQTVNQGQAAGFNLALEHARGEWIAFIDSDDLWSADKLAEAMAYLEAHPRVGLLHHNLEILRHEERTGEPTLAALLEGDLAKWHQRTGQIPAFAPTAGLIVRRSVMDAILPLPTAFKTCADGFVTRSAMCFTEVGAIQRCLGAYRIHGENNVCSNPDFDVPAYIREDLVPTLNAFYAAKGLAFRLQLHSGGSTAAWPTRLLKPLRRLLPTR